jgi:hypothetical protein
MAWKWILPAAVAAGLLAAPAWADDTEDDVRCVVLSLEMVTSSDDAVKNAGALVAMYYLGRLDGRTPDVNLEDKIKAEIGAMTPDVVQATAARCSMTLRARGLALTQMGKDIQQNGEAPAPPAPQK